MVQICRFVCSSRDRERWKDVSPVNWRCCQWSTSLKRLQRRKQWWRDSDRQSATCNVRLQQQQQQQNVCLFSSVLSSAQSHSVPYDHTARHGTRLTVPLADWCVVSLPVCVGSSAPFSRSLSERFSHRSVAAALCCHVACLLGYGTADRNKIHNSC